MAGLFGFGASKSSQSSQSNSLDYGANASQSFSDSLAQASSRNGGQSTSTQGIAFEDVIRDLYSRSQGAAAGAAEAVPLLQGQAGMLFNSGSKFLDSLGGGSDYLSSRVDGSSPILDEQIGALGNDLGSFFSEQINPALRLGAAANGTSGGGRAGVAQGVAANGIAKQFAQGATALRANDINARDAAAISLLNNQTAAAGTGLNSLSSLYDIAGASANAGLAPYQALSQIIGGPTTLTNAQSTEFGESSSEQIARAVSEALGFNYGTSSSSSQGSSKSFNFGVGPG